MKWILMLGLMAFGYQALADDAVVIDSSAIGQSPSSSTGTGAGAGAGAAVPQNNQADANAVNKELFLKGGRMSPREKAAVAKAEMAETNQQVGNDFLASNQAKPGVVSLASGVQYRVLRAGNGKKPTEQSIIRCRYKGTLTDGTQFDKSDDKKPSSMHVDGLLPGLKEAVKLMPTGSKWEIVVPPQLAYGTFGNRGVGPNAVLIYDMEILGIR